MRSGPNRNNAPLHQLQQKLLDRRREVNPGETPLPQDHPEHFEETKRPWPATSDQWRWSTTQHPPSQLSESSLPYVPPSRCTVELEQTEDSVIIHFGQESQPQVSSDANIELRTVATHPGPASLANAGTDALRSITDFLELAEVLSFARTTKRNQEFVAITIPQVQLARREHQLLAQNARCANLLDKLSVFMAGATGMSSVGFALTWGLSEELKGMRGWDDESAGYATRGLACAIPLFFVLFCVARCSADRFRTGQAPEGPREALRQVQRRCDDARALSRQEIESKRALARLNAQVLPSEETTPGPTDTTPPDSPRNDRTT